MCAWPRNCCRITHILIAEKYWLWWEQNPLSPSFCHNPVGPLYLVQACWHSVIFTGQIMLRSPRRQQQHYDIPGDWISEVWSRISGRCIVDSGNCIPEPLLYKN
ncbi:MAG: hypothetical protein PHT07_23035 [Paludibacter sp.]|nr:hypothetical protein [Paludibacter sp.]